MGKPPSPESLKALRETLTVLEQHVALIKDAIPKNLADQGKDYRAMLKRMQSLQDQIDSLGRDAERLDATPRSQGTLDILNSLIQELDRVLGFSPGTLSNSITERIGAAPQSSPAESPTPQSLPVAGPR